jgi:hypothetical protein
MSTIYSQFCSKKLALTCTKKLPLSLLVFLGFLITSIITQTSHTSPRLLRPTSPAYKCCTAGDGPSPTAHHQVEVSQLQHSPASFSVSPTEHVNHFNIPTINLHDARGWNLVLPPFQASTFENIIEDLLSQPPKFSTLPISEPDITVGYLNIRKLATTKSMFIASFMYHYKIDVLFLLDSQVTHPHAITHSLRQHLPACSTILNSPFLENESKAGGQTIIIAATWSGSGYPLVGTNKYMFLVNHRRKLG